MKIAVIGAAGIIGRAVAESLVQEHEVVRIGNKRGDYQMDLADSGSIEAALWQIAPLDAIVCTAGQAGFGPLNDLTSEDYQLALENKLMGQVNLLRIARQYLRDGGSITLTSGLLAKEPMPGSAIISMVNGSLESYVKAPSLEEERIRLNVVSPIFVKETMVQMGMDSTSGMSAADTAKAYKAAVTGEFRGETLNVRDFA